MGLLHSSLAQVCRSFGQQLSLGVNGPATTAVRVLIGTPSDAAPGESDPDHRLNLFFFRFETSGFDGSVLPGDPWLLRMHCLVTPFCVAEAPIPAGENDLRLMGEVLRHIHEHPVSEITLDDGESFLVQSIFLNLGLDQINQLWSTQGDTVYRPSLLLEVSLAPIMPRKATVPSPLVAGVGLDVRAQRLRRGEGLEGIEVQMLQVGVLSPDTDVEDWAPDLLLLNGTDGTVLRSISLAIGSPALNTFAPRALLAGEPGSQVSLRWSQWEKSSGWQDSAGVQAAQIQRSHIDPAQPPSAATLPLLTLPFTDRPGQLMLVAERHYTRQADGAMLTVRSDPILINLYQAAP